MGMPMVTAREWYQHKTEAISNSSTEKFALSFSTQLLVFKKVWMIEALHFETVRYFEGLIYNLPYDMFYT